jgi:hypothetical protein
MTRTVEETLLVRQQSALSMMSQNDDGQTRDLQAVQDGGLGQGVHVKREFYTGHVYDIAVL